MLMSSQLDKIVKLVNEWKPRRHRDEHGYKEELAEFLRQKGLPAVTEANRRLCDIAVGSVAIELKKDFRGASLRGLRDQIQEQRQKFRGGVVVVLVGRTDPNTYIKLRDWAEKMNQADLLSAQPQVKVIDKGGKREAKLEVREAEEPKAGAEGMEELIRKITGGS
jgi:hypothetical protein